MIARRRRGFTLVEIVVAFSILLILVLLALGVITNMQGPTTEITLRADMTSKGNASMNLLLQELEGAAYDTPDLMVGVKYSPALRDIDETPGGGPLPGTPDVNGFFDHTDPSFGSAIRCYQIDGFAPPSTLVLGETVVFAFVQGPGGDGDRDGLVSEWHLIRVEPSTGKKEIIIQHDICDGAQPDLPPGVNVQSPYFELTWPANLRIVFSLAKQTGYDTQTNKRQYSVVRYDRLIHLRNVTPP